MAVRLLASRNGRALPQEIFLFLVLIYFRGGVNPLAYAVEKIKEIDNIQLLHNVSISRLSGL
jgi:hypothetical protein